MQVAKGVSALRKSVTSILADDGLLDKEPALAATMSEFRTYLRKVEVTGEALTKAEQEGETVLAEARASVLQKDTPMSNKDDKLTIFVPITKYDAAKQLVYGTIAAEVPDKSKEIMDYDTAKKAFQTWSDEISKASDGKSLGNVRVMHQPIVGGKMVSIDFDDEKKTISGVSKILNTEAERLIAEGALTGFSIGGGYAKRWQDPTDKSLRRYTPSIAEVSYVDNPCIPGATFEYVKTDGTTELRKFNPGLVEDVVRRLMKDAADGDSADSTQPKGVKTGLGDHDGKQGVDGDEGDADTKLKDASKAKPGTKSVSPKDDGSAQDKVAPKVSDSTKEAGADSTVGKAAPTNSEIAEKATELAKEAGKPTEWASFIGPARDALTKAVTDAEAEKVAAEEAAKKAEAEKTVRDALDKMQVGPQGEDIGAHQVWAHKDLPSQVFATKRELRAALVSKSANEVANKAAGAAHDTLKEINDLLVDKNMDKVWKSNEELPSTVQGLPDEAKSVFREAANGHLKKGGDDESAMKIGWTAVKNGWSKGKDEKWTRNEKLAKKEFSADERKKLAGEGKAMKDGSYPIESTEDLHNAIQAFGRSNNKAATKRHIKARAAALGATASLPEDWGKMVMPELAKSPLGSLLVALETVEDLYADEDDNLVVQKVTEAADAIADVLGDEEDELFKRGARNSKTDKQLIKGAHDTMAQLDPDCCPGGKDDDGDEDDAEKLEVAVLEKVTAERDALTKTLDTMTGTLKDVLGRVQEMATRVEKIEKTPVGVTLSGPRTYQVVDKAAEMSGGGDAPDINKTLSDPAVMEKLADAAVRAAQRRPMHEAPGLMLGKK
jgi:cation transport regulator ChaB